MAKVLANHHNATVTTNDFALVANLLHAWLYFHDPSPISLLLFTNTL
jgi:hypothetical protein